MKRGWKRGKVRIGSASRNFTAGFAIKLGNKHSLARHVSETTADFNGWISNYDTGSEFMIRSRFYGSQLDTGEPGIYRFARSKLSGKLLVRRTEWKNVEVLAGTFIVLCFPAGYLFTCTNICTVSVQMRRSYISLLQYM